MGHWCDVSGPSTPIDFNLYGSGLFYGFTGYAIREGGGDNFTNMVVVFLQVCTYASHIVFSVGIVLTSWIHSKLVGWTSTISAILFVALSHSFSLEQAYSSSRPSAEEDDRSRSKIPNDQFLNFTYLIFPL